MPDQITYTEHAQDVLEKAHELISRGDHFALITSVDIKGGTARELGSLALVTALGDMFGYLSNGCIDQDIRLNALRCLAKKERKVVHYGEGSPFPDLTLPCGGKLKVLIDPEPDRQVLMAALDDLVARRPARLIFHTSQAAQTLEVEYRPKPKVTLAGRGAVFRATTKLAQLAGFDVSCISPDEDDATALKDACGLTVHPLLSPASAIDLSLDQWSAFLTLFHDHSWEPALLQRAVQTPCHFIGALGSQKTHEARKAVLLAMGCEPADVERIHGPVGLVPSLRSADLIAVAVTAELAAAFSRSQQVVTGQKGSTCQKPVFEPSTG